MDAVLIIIVSTFSFWSGAYNPTGIERVPVPTMEECRAAAKELHNGGTVKATCGLAGQFVTEWRPVYARSGNGISRAIRESGVTS